MYSEIASNKRKSIILIGIFLVLVIGLGLIIDAYYDSGGAITVIALIYSVITALVSYYSGDKMALWAAGAREIKKEDSPELWRLVENLCIADGLPMPKVHLIDDPAPNAFATGRDPKTSSIAVTTGLLERLDRTELEGVVAHELSHIKNYDIRVMTIVVVLVGVIAVMANIFMRIGLRGGGGNRKREGGAVLLVLGLVAIILAPIIANLVKLAVSRRREYLADASGALLTRFPEGLARALEKISSYDGALRHAGSATAHLYIANPFGKGGWAAGLTSTHPPIEKRIAALRQMGTTA
ncbi:MAG TPA: M48 family metallopeptidase [Candidatus Baltobacteraceae bacterium]|nr:M48 family metallopeptidase [Candidatus Baltobacteraceae bacterium]